MTHDTLLATTGGDYEPVEKSRQTNLLTDLPTIPALISKGRF